MRVALAQLNFTVGDLEANTDRLLRCAREANDQGADLAVFPELSICGYPPLDLVTTAGFRDANEAQLQRLARESASLDTALVVGYCGVADESGNAANCLACLERGRIVFRQRKLLLPTYDVFDEARYFRAGKRIAVWEFRGRRIGLTICEDAWNDKQFWERSRYSMDPVEELAGQGIDLLVNISASPYHVGRRGFRLAMFKAMAARHRVPVALVNQVGGNDQLIFDGSSFAIDGSGTLQARALSFAEDVVCWEPGSPCEAPEDTWSEESAAGDTDAVYDALVLGTRDYVRKCGFSKAIIGMSGGIDSALTTVIATEALGASNVTGVAMPGPYSSEGSLSDARRTAEAMGIQFLTIGINPAYRAFEEQLAPAFKGLAPNIAEENLQARLRGTTLMALSNKFHSLVLTTGNKSELAVGYCTIYGDMCGGLAVISDVPKTLAYELARVANRRHRGGIPQSVLDKPPSAELRPDQKDSDSLPPYEVLDPILRLYVEECLSAPEIAERLGHPIEMVRDIARMVDRNEYKRQQAAPGLRVTSKAFGMGRRFPIAQRHVR
ncbi:MAG: NAD+ synthase [Bryobacterales bacterium]|nr:NAD+ synthase [Bryobacterales bacterium]MDE0622152.1 NAD+ synthase [Bryobacterales bacterium]